MLQKYVNICCGQQLCLAHLLSGRHRQLMEYCGYVNKNLLKINDGREMFQCDKMKNTFYYYIRKDVHNILNENVYR